MAAGGTIAAIASPRGAGLRGVLRVSGPDAWSVVSAVWCGATALPDPAQRGFHPGRFDDGRGEQPLLLLWMPGPRSFTREDVAEFHLPGSPALLESALARILSLGVRAAGPGEFTRRAFENGRIDLTRAEGILALVHARSEAQRRSASALLFGGLADRLVPLREGLEALRALAEASLDFDEADTGHVPSEELGDRARVLLRELREASHWEARRVARSDLPQVVLVGAPNAGKSSLFNALVADVEALVSEEPGTTRDVLEGVWSTPGGEVRLFDTAGIDDGALGSDAVAQRFGQGIRASADLQLWIVECERLDSGELEAEEQRLAADVPILLVCSKAEENLEAPELPPGLGPQVQARVAASALCGAGLEQLGQEVSRFFWPSQEPGAGLVGASPRLEREIGVRHRVALTRSAEALERGSQEWRSGLPLDLFAESLREACAELDEISGRTTAEDLLDRIFGAFCIGK